MKNLIVVLLLFLASFTGIKAQNNALFEKANTLYNENKFQEAIDAYQSILEQGQESVSVYYNLGNAYYKLSNIGNSIYYYEKALQLDPNDEDVQNNLGFAKNATVDAIDVIPEGIVTKTINNFTNIVNFDTWAWISVLGMLSFITLFIAYYNTVLTSRKRLLFIGSIVVLGISLAGITFAFKQYNYIQNHKFGIIFAQESKVKSEPNLRSEEVFQLHEGTKVQITDAVNEWKKIKLTDGKIGWIPSSDLKEL